MRDTTDEDEEWWASIAFTLMFVGALMLGGVFLVTLAFFVRSLVLG